MSEFWIFFIIGFVAGWALTMHFIEMRKRNEGH
jgi:hypothetical protein